MPDDENTNKFHDWSALYDAEGNIYYYNNVTEETTWDKPSEPHIPLEKGFDEIQKAQEEGTWEQHTDEGGNVYYYNTATEVTTWDKPEEFENNKQINEDENQGEEEEEPLPSSPISRDGDGEEENSSDEAALSSSPVLAVQDDVDEDGNKQPAAKNGVWNKHTTAEGEEYYYNLETEETTWDRPPDFVEEDDEAVATTREEEREPIGGDVEMEDEKNADNNSVKTSQGGWEKVTDDDGNVYYYNNTAETTQWEKPDVFLDDNLNNDIEQHIGDPSSAKQQLSETTTQKESPCDVGTSTGTTSCGHWEQLFDDEGRPYFFNSETDVTQWDKPTDFSKDDDNNNNEQHTRSSNAISSSPPPGTAATPDGKAEGQWEKYTDDEGRTYFYNAASGETQWGTPDDFVDHEDDDEDEKNVDEFQLTPQTSPSPDSMQVEGVETEDCKVKMEYEKSPEPEESFDPAVKRVRDAEEALNQPDSALEPGTFVL